MFVLIYWSLRYIQEHYNLRLASGYLSFFGLPILSIFVYKLPPDPAEPEPMERFPMLSGMYSRMLLSSVELENMFEPEIRARQTSERVYFFGCLIAALTCLTYIAATYTHPTSDRLTHYFTASVVAPAVGWFVILCCRFLPDRTFTLIHVQLMILISPKCPLRRDTVSRVAPCTYLCHL